MKAVEAASVEAAAMKATAAVEAAATVAAAEPPGRCRAVGNQQQCAERNTSRENSNGPLAHDAPPLQRSLVRQ
jgi:hypothetical protein